jgi:hypothetical protein
VHFFGGEFLFKWALENPVVGVLLGVGLAFLGIFLGDATWSQNERAARGPIPQSLAEASAAATIKAQWVTLEGLDGIQWDCESLVTQKYNGSTWMTAAFVDATQTIYVQAVIHDPLSCDELQQKSLDSSGNLRRLKDSELEKLRAQLTKYDKATTFVEFCEFCEPRESEFGLIFSASLTVLGVVLGCASIYRVVKKYVGLTMLC